MRFQQVRQSHMVKQVQPWQQVPQDPCVHRVRSGRAVLRPGFDGGSDDRKDHCAWDRGSTRLSFVSGRRG